MCPENHDKSRGMSTRLLGSHAANALAAPMLWFCYRRPLAESLYSYWAHTYDGALGAAIQPKFELWGTLSSVSINVVKAYSGTGALSFHLSQFDNWPVIISGGSASYFGPSVDVRQLGNRIITPSGVTGSFSTDVGLSVGQAVWFTGSSNSGPQYSADVSSNCPGPGCPSVTVVIQTDQGIQNH